MTTTARLRALLTAHADFETEWDRASHTIPSYNPDPADGTFTTSDDCDQYDDLCAARDQLFATVEALDALLRELEAATACRPPSKEHCHDPHRAAPGHR
ncbi:hypothetical protein [Kitasatospora sp. NPDC058046]|uniref:hypothetical protein n=1 Tax=Kitasatospora sp. NPDC058046 TaxID=3346312 RepID=UPI0036DECCAF